MTKTITPVMHHTTTITCLLTSPFHHGAGTSGNTAVLRTQDVIQPDGTTARVPYLSGASVRHALREALAWHTAHTLTWSRSLTKSMVDLLWSGGAVTSTGSQVDLAMARRVDDIYPALGLLGYAAQSDITTGTLRASDLILTCAENAWRLPDNTPGTNRRAAAYRTETFGTRHDIASTPAAMLIADLDATQLTTQMIFDTQILAAGSTLHGTIGLTASATAGQHLAYRAALGLWAPNGEAFLGAKTAQGYGRATITGINHDETTAAVDAWTNHLLHHGQAILDLIRDLAG